MSNDTGKLYHSLDKEILHPETRAEVVFLDTDKTKTQAQLNTEVVENFHDLLDFDGTKLTPLVFWSENADGFYIDPDGPFVMSMDLDGNYYWKNISNIPQIVVDDITHKSYKITIRDGEFGWEEIV